MAYQYNPDCQKLADLYAQTGPDRLARIYCTDGEVFEGYADCWTWVEIGDDEDVPAMCFVRRDGSLYDVAGAQIDRFEILEPR